MMRKGKNILPYLNENNINTRDEFSGKSLLSMASILTNENIIINMIEKYNLIADDYITIHTLLLYRGFFNALKLLINSMGDINMLGYVSDTDNHAFTLSFNLNDKLIEHEKHFLKE